MKKSIIVSAIALALSVSSMGFAAESSKEKVPGAGPNPFSDCGIGAALFQGENVKALAVTSNVIWDLGTTAITSATASPDTCSGKQVKAATFILENYDNLAEETARGAGDHVDALFNIVELDDSAKVSAISKIRAQMAEAVNTSSYISADKVGKATIYYNILSNSLQNSAS